MPHQEPTGLNAWDTGLRAVAASVGHRGRRPVEVPTTEHVRATARRYYCPTCGEVHEAHGKLDILTFETVWFVPSHWRWSYSDYRVNDCPGGTIDKDKDRAP